MSTPPGDNAPRWSTAPSPPRPAPRVNRYAGVALVVAVVFLGVVPIAQYVEARVSASRADLQTATVTGTGRTGRTGKAGSTSRWVDVELPDGTRAGVAYGLRVLYPDEGDTIEVYRDGDRWRSPGEVPVTYPLGGGLVLLLAGAGSVHWLRRRRRALLAADSRG